MQQARAPRRIAGARRSVTPITPHQHSGLEDPTTPESPPPSVPAPARPDEAPADTRVLLTPEQAAELLQVRPSWLRRKAAARAIPCRYLGKHLRFTHADLTAIAEQSAAGTTRTHRRRVP